MDIEKTVKELLDDPKFKEEILGYAELNTSPRKLIDCPHEIIFSVESNIMEQNEKRENVGSKLIHKRNFHMPVPPGEDPEEYMSIFLKHFENSLAKTAKEISNE